MYRARWEFQRYDVTQGGKTPAATSTATFSVLRSVCRTCLLLAPDVRSTLTSTWQDRKTISGAALTSYTYNCLQQMQEAFAVRTALLSSGLTKQAISLDHLKCEKNNFPHEGNILRVFVKVRIHRENKFTLFFCVDERTVDSYPKGSFDRWRFFPANNLPDIGCRLSFWSLMKLLFVSMAAVTSITVCGELRLFDLGARVI